MDEHLKTAARLLRLLALVAVLSAGVRAQSIRLVRSDVDPGRSGFVTATQSFGMDVVIDSLDDCTSASFELRFTNAQYCVFSHWKTRDLGKKGVFVYDLTDSLGNGSVHVGALSGMGATDSAFSNPVVIHLDFVVLPDAPNDSTITFSFVYPQAVTTDSGGTIVKLRSTPTTVTIHGFVRVHPGDADNNGVVDSRDATTVGAFIKQGSGTSNVRGYKREPASTLWLPQASLVWDSARATYADCDGSGDVTLSDNLVVQINFGKTHTRTKNERGIQSCTTTLFPSEYTRQPLRIIAPENILGVAVNARSMDAASRVVGFEPAENLPGVHPSFFSYENGNLLLVFGSENGTDCMSSGIVGSLVIDGPASPMTMTQVLGATSDGRIFPLVTTTTDVEEKTCPGDDACSIRVNVDRAGSALEVTGMTDVTGGVLSICSVTGQELVRMRIDADTRVPVSLPHGMYVLSISSSQPIAKTFVW